MQRAKGKACIACLTMLLAVIQSQAQAAEAHKKWIIVTTINYPTESIRILANMTGWKVSSGPCRLLVVYFRLCVLTKQPQRAHLQSVSRATLNALCKT